MTINARKGRSIPNTATPTHTALPRAGRVGVGVWMGKEKPPPTISVSGSQALWNKNSDRVSEGELRAVSERAETTHDGTITSTGKLARDKPPAIASRDRTEYETVFDYCSPLCHTDDIF